MIRLQVIEHDHLKLYHSIPVDVEHANGEFKLSILGGALKASHPEMEKAMETLSIELPKLFLNLRIKNRTPQEDRIFDKLCKIMIVKRNPITWDE